MEKIKLLGGNLNGTVLEVLEIRDNVFILGWYNFEYYTRVHQITDHSGFPLYIKIYEGYTKDLKQDVSEE